MVEDSWEQRMSDRAKSRRPIVKEDHFVSWEVRHARAWKTVSHMTLGEAMETIAFYKENGPMACACPGLPCCWMWHDQAKALVRAAHIIVKMINEVE